MLAHQFPDIIDFDQPIPYALSWEDTPIPFVIVDEKIDNAAPRVHSPA